MIFRSDCMANLLLWYLMGATEGMRAEPINMGEIQAMFSKWKDRIAQTGSFIMPYAEDAEYIGSSAYFYVKQFNQARFFEAEPDSVTRFKEILDAAKEAGYELLPPARCWRTEASWKTSTWTTLKTVSRGTVAQRKPGPIPSILESWIRVLVRPKRH